MAIATRRIDHFAHACGATTGPAPVGMATRRRNPVDQRRYPGANQTSPAPGLTGAMVPGGVVTSGDDQLNPGLAAVAIAEILSLLPIPMQTRCYLQATTPWFRHGQFSMAASWSKASPLDRLQGLTASWAWPWWARSVAREQTALSRQPRPV